MINRLKSVGFYLIEFYHLLNKIFWKIVSAVDTSTQQLKELSIKWLALDDGGQCICPTIGVLEECAYQMAHLFRFVVQRQGSLAIGPLLGNVRQRCIQYHFQLLQLQPLLHVHRHLHWVLLTITKQGNMIIACVSQINIDCCGQNLHRTLMVPYRIFHHKSLPDY